jgi:hypothetical protein
VRKIVVVLPDEHEDRNELIIEDCRNLARKNRIVCMTPEPVPSNLIGDRLERDWLERINKYWRNGSDIRRRAPTVSIYKLFMFIYGSLCKQFIKGL